VETGGQGVKRVQDGRSDMAEPSKPSNAVDGRPRRPTIQLIELSGNGAGTVTVLRVRPTREVRSRCAAPEPSTTETVGSTVSLFFFLWNPNL